MSIYAGDYELSDENLPNIVRILFLSVRYRASVCIGLIQKEFFTVCRKDAIVFQMQISVWFKCQIQF